MPPIAKRTAAYDIEAIRAQLRRDVKPPAGLLQKAFGVLDQQLEANETKLVTYHGAVTGKVEVPDNPTRLKAAETVARIAGFTPGNAPVEEVDEEIIWEVDPVTGRTQLIIRKREAPALGAALPDVIDVEATPAVETAPEAEEQPSIESYSTAADDIEIVKVRRENGRTPPEIVALLMGAPPPEKKQ